VKVVISTDAHRVAELDYQRYGVEQARRAWLAKADVLNTLPLPRFLAALDKLRARRRSPGRGA
jgi:DNA polymerase (family 10)